MTVLVDIKHGFGWNTLAQLRQIISDGTLGPAAAQLTAVQNASPYLITNGARVVGWNCDEGAPGSQPHRLPYLWVRNGTYTSPPTGNDISNPPSNGIIRGMSVVPGSLNNSCVELILPYYQGETTPSNNTYRCLFAVLDGSSQYEFPYNTDMSVSFRLRLPTDSGPSTGNPMNSNSSTLGDNQRLIWQFHPTASGVGTPEWSIALQGRTELNLIKNVWQSPAPAALQPRGTFAIYDPKPLDTWINIVILCRAHDTNGHFEVYASTGNNDASTNKVFDFFDEYGSNRPIQAPGSQWYGSQHGNYGVLWSQDFPSGQGAERSIQLNVLRIATGADAAITNPDVQPWLDGGGGGDTTPPTKPVIVLAAGAPDTTVIDATESTSTDDTGVTDWKFYKQTDSNYIRNPDFSTNDFAATDGDYTTGWQRVPGAGGWSISGGQLVSAGVETATWTQPNDTESALVAGNYVEVQFDYAQTNAIGTLTASMGSNPNYDTDPTDSRFVATLEGSGSFREVYAIADYSLDEFRFKAFNGWEGTIDNVSLRKLLLDDTEAAGAHSYTGLTEATLYRMNVQTLDAATNPSEVSDTAELTTVDASPPVDPLTAAPYSEDAVNKNSSSTTHTPIADGRPSGGTLDYSVLSVSPITGCSVSVASNIVTFTPNQTFSGNATYSITFGDSSDPQQSVTVTVTTAVTNHAPVAVDQDTPGDRKVGENQTLQFLMTGYATDSDGDPLDYSEVTSAGSIGTFTVLADGVTGQYVSTGGTGNDVTPTFKATDDSSQDSNTAAIHFQVVTPAAIDDVFFLDRGETSYELDVLANDQDPLEAGLEITHINGETVFPTDVGNGQVSTDGATITYAPVDPTVTRYTDTFTYTITDGTNSNTGNVSVTVSAQDDNAPAAVAGTLVDVPMYNPVQSVTVDLEALVSSVFGGPYTWGVTEQATYGTATISSAGIMTYTPGYLKFGIYTVEWSVISDAGNEFVGSQQFNVVPGTRLPR